MKKNISYWLMPMAVKKSVDWVIDSVCTYFGITILEMRSKSRVKKYVEARRMIAYLLYSNKYKLTFKEIGILLGYRNHATIISLVRSAQGFIEVDKEYKELVMSFY